MNADHLKERRVSIKLSVPMKRVVEFLERQKDDRLYSMAELEAILNYSPRSLNDYGKFLPLKSCRLYDAMGRKYLYGRKALIRKTIERLKKEHSI